MEVPQNFSAVARNEVLKIFFCYVLLLLKMQLECALHGFQVMPLKLLWSVASPNTFMHSYVPFCVHILGSSKENIGCGSEEFGGQFSPVKPKRQTAERCRRAGCGALSLSLYVAPGGAAMRVPRQVKVLLTLRGPQG